MVGTLDIRSNKKFLPKKYIQFQQLKFARKWELSESSLRSIVKTVSWRLTGSGATFLISYIILGSFDVAGTIAIFQLTLNTILYYFHERIWNIIKWGRAIEVEK